MKPRDRSVNLLKSMGISPSCKRPSSVLAPKATGTVMVSPSRNTRNTSESGADVILLDNMDVPMLSDVVNEIRADERWNNVLLEASGGISLDTLPEVAGTGVDIISSGSLIHGATFVDLAMEMEHTP